MSTTAFLPTPPALASSTTLFSVLQQLGHQCADSCPAASDPAMGTVWFARHGRRRDSSLVVVDTAPAADTMSVHHLLQGVNACTRRHRIRVLARQPEDRGRALASLSPQPLVSA